MSGIAMTPIDLVDTLVEFIKPIVVEFDLESNVPGISKSPRVIYGWLMDKRPTDKQDPPDFPCVIVKFQEDTDTEASDSAKIMILAGTYSKDIEDGWRDCMNVITKIKGALMKQRFFGAFKIEYPVKTELPEEQPFPQWFAVLNLTVTIPHNTEEGGYLKDVFD